MERDIIEKVVEKHRQIQELKRLKDRIIDGHASLFYAEENDKGDDFALIPKFYQQCIDEILDLYDFRIRKEIDQRIEQLKKELDEL